MAGRAPVERAEARVQDLLVEDPDGHLGRVRQLVRRHRERAEPEREVAVLRRRKPRRSPVGEDREAADLASLADDCREAREELEMEPSSTVRCETSVFGPHDRRRVRELERRLLSKIRIEGGCSTGASRVTSESGYDACSRALPPPVKNAWSVCAASWTTWSPSTRPGHPRSSGRSAGWNMQSFTAHGSVCTTTSAIPGTALRTPSSISLARVCASASDASAPSASVRNDDDAVVRPHEAELARRRARLLADDALDGVRVDLDLARGRGLGQRLEVRAHVRDLGHRGEDRALDLLGHVVRLVEREVAGELEVQRDLDAPVDVQHGEVVELPHARDAERGRERALAEAGIGVARLDVDDDVRLGQARAHGVLDPVRGGMTLADGGPGRDPDDDVREVRAAGGANAQPPELDRRVERGDRAPGGLLRATGARSMSTSMFLRSSLAGREDDEPGDEERRDRVALREAERGREEPREHGERADEVAPEMEGVREQRVAPVLPPGAERDDGARGVDGDDERDRGKGPPARLDLELDPAGEPRDRDAGDEEADRDQEPGLRERGEVLGLAVAERVPASRPAARRPRRRRR